MFADAEHAVRAEDAERVEILLDRPHQFEGGGIGHLQKVRHLLRAKTVLTRDGAARFHGDPEDLTGQLLALLDIRLEDGEVDIAVAHVAAPAHEGLVCRRQLGDLGQVVGDGGAGDHGVDDVVGARRLGHEKEALSRGDQRGARLRRQDVDVDRAEVAEQCAQLFHVLVEAGLRRLLQHHDEVRQRPLLHVFGDAEVEARRSGDAAQHQGVGVLEDRRVDPLATIRGTACVTSARVANGTSTVVDSVMRGCTLTVTSVVTARVPSEPTRSCVRS